jgi:uncharacterized BrkB/YihY/UPF0761 family membrane protein
MQILGANITLPKPKITITQRDIEKVLPSQTRAAIADQVQTVTGTKAIQRNVLIVGVLAAAALALIAVAVYKRKGKL